MRKAISLTSGLAGSSKKATERCSSDMLMRTILLPSTLDTVPEDPLSQRLFCSVCIRLLHDLLENGVVLVDEGNCVTGALFQALDKWPPKFRKRGKELLTRLRALNRFVKVPADYVLSSICRAAPCQHCLGI